jgi:hypothetical protein
MPPGALDEFGQNASLVDIDQPIHEFLGETEPLGLRLKSSKSTTSLPSDNLSSRLSTPSGVAFANRYDFGASLSAVMQAQRSPKSSPRQNDGLYMKAHQRGSFDSSQPTDANWSQSSVSQSDDFTAQQPAGPQASTADPPSPGTVTDSPASASIASASYEEILNKYCFVRTSTTSPVAHGF